MKRNSIRTMISAVVIATAIASPVFAENAHDHGDKNQGANNGMMMGMMNHDQMMAMHDHIEKNACPDVRNQNRNRPKKNVNN